MSDNKSFLPLKVGHVYRTACGSIFIVDKLRSGGLEVETKLISSAEVDLRKQWPCGSVCGVWYSREDRYVRFHYWYHAKNGHVDVDRVGHPLNVVEEIEP